MSYEYTDIDGDKLTVWGVGDDMVNIAATEDESRTLIGIKNTDAPAIALAILEAAGVKGGTASTSSIDQAAGYLRQHEMYRAKRAEREAEDAKVRDYYNRGLPRTLDRASWNELSPEAHEMYRESYQAARDFFRESP